jgi:dephospho-CoA kinase
MEEKRKLIIGLVGETGSGKDTVAKYLNEKYGAKLMRFADPIKETLNIFFDKSSKQDQQWLFTEFKKRFGGNVLGMALRKKIERNDGLIVVNGLRMLEDYGFIKSFSDSVILYITADQKLRWERVAGRGEKSDDNIDLEKFQEIERAETEIHIPELGSRAEFVIKNEKDLAYLLSETDRVMGKIMQ